MLLAVQHHSALDIGATYVADTADGAEGLSLPGGLSVMYLRAVRPCTSIQIVAYFRPRLSHWGSFMAVDLLLDNAKVDTVGKETPIRIVGNREPPAKMSIQVDVTGTATVQLHGRVSKNAPWVEMGMPHTASSITSMDPIPFLRVVTTGVGAASAVSVWAIWGW